MSVACIKEWFNRFKLNKSPLKVNFEVKDHQRVLTDHILTVRKIVNDLEVNIGSVHTILMDDFDQ